MLSVPKPRNRHRVAFRFPTPLASTEGEVQWKRQTVARVSVPVLSVEEFLNGLTLNTSRSRSGIGPDVLPCRAFVPGKGTGLIATAVLSSSYPLAPLAHLGLSVSFRNERTGRSWDVPVPLTADQRSGTSAIVSAACPRGPRRPGLWTATWRAGGRELAASSAEAIACPAFRGFGPSR